MAVEAVFIFDRAACVGPEIANRPETVLPGLGAIAGRLAPAGACFCGLCAAELFCSPAPRGLVTSGAVSCSWLGLAVRFSVAGPAVEVRQSRSAACSDGGKAFGPVADRFPSHGLCDALLSRPAAPVQQARGAWRRCGGAAGCPGRGYPGPRRAMDFPGLPHAGRNLLAWL